MTGRFIVFDGLDGAGKSTAMQVIASELRARGQTVTTTREPGGTPLAESIRRCMLDDWAEAMPAATEVLLAYAARAAHLTNLIIPALNRGDTVLCDRFADSSHVYQGTLGGISDDWLTSLDAQVVIRPPDLVFLFDLPVDVAARRISQRGRANRFDAASRERLTRVREAFRQRAHSNVNRYCVIDAEQAEDQVRAQILQRLEALA